MILCGTNLSWFRRASCVVIFYVNSIWILDDFYLMSIYGKYNSDKFTVIHWGLNIFTILCTFCRIIRSPCVRYVTTLSQSRRGRCQMWWWDSTLTGIVNQTPPSTGERCDWLPLLHMIWLDFSYLYRIFMWFKVYFIHLYIGFSTVYIVKRVKINVMSSYKNNLNFVLDIHQQMFI